MEPALEMTSFVALTVTRAANNMSRDEFNVNGGEWKPTTCRRRCHFYTRSDLLTARRGGREQDLRDDSVDQNINIRPVHEVASVQVSGSTR